MNVTEETDQSFARAAPPFIGNNFKKPDDRPSTWVPDWAVLCEVDIKASGGDFDLSFSKMKVIQLKAADKMQEFIDMLPGVCEENATNDWYRPQIKDEGKKISDLSIWSEYCSAIAIKLSGKKNKSWKFARIESPITVENDTTYMAACEARTVSPQGIPMPPDQQDAGWDVAYFVAGPAANFKTADDGRKVLLFNLHVEIISKNSKYKHIPVIIDPDVGHPGGTKP